MWRWFIEFNIGNVVLSGIGLVIMWPWLRTADDIGVQLISIAIGLGSIVISGVATSWLFDRRLRRAREVGQ